MFLGFQNFRKTEMQIRLIRAEVMSGSSGPMKLEVNQTPKAKDPPATRIAGQVSRTPFQPSMMKMIQNGTNTANRGS